jgi:hypothetical protein
MKIKILGIIFATLFLISINTQNSEANDAPFIAALIIDDPDHGDNVYSDGDTITLKFSEDTNMPTVNKKSDLDKLIYSPYNLGKDYVGEFINPSTLIITVINSESSNIINAEDLVLVLKHEGNLQNADESSLPSEATSPNPIGNFGGFSLIVPVELNSGTITAPLPFGLVMDWQFPADVSGKVSVSSVEFDKITRIDDKTVQKIMGAIEISPFEGANCINGCSISFHITESDLSYAELNTDEIRVYRDIQDDGQFTKEDELETTVTKFESDKYIVTAETKFNSKFAVGGIKHLLLGGVVLLANNHIEDISPKLQMESGIEAKDVKCHDGFQSLIKKTTMQGVCVKTSSMEKLIQRGWAIVY